MRSKIYGYVTKIYLPMKDITMRMIKLKLDRNFILKIIFADYEVIVISFIIRNNFSVQ